LDSFCHLFKGDKMSIRITLYDDEGDPVLTLSNCDKPELVFISFVDEDDSVVVNIKDLRTALRKISAK
jgi:hypothetical protein